MRSALVTLLCTLGLTASGGTGARAGDKADVEKELKKFQGTWTFESVEAGGKKVPADEFQGITVTGGRGTSGFAGGIWAVHATVVFRDCVITANTSDTNGGGAMLLDGPFLASAERKKRREKRGEPRPKKIYDTLHQALARFRFAPDQDCANLFSADWIARSSLRQFRRADGSVASDHGKLLR